MGMTEWHVRRVEDTQLPRYSPASVEISHEPVLRSSRWKSRGPLRYYTSVEVRSSKAASDPLLVMVISNVDMRRRFYKYRIDTKAHSIRSQRDYHLFLLADVPATRSRRRPWVAECHLGVVWESRDQPPQGQ